MLAVAFPFVLRPIWQRWLRCLVLLEKLYEAYLGDVI